IKRAWSYVKTSRSDVSAVFPTANAFRRQKDMGLLQLLKEATEQRGVRTRILIPASEEIMHVIDVAMTICPLVDFRIAEGNLQTQITLVLIDNEHCMIVELKDDTRDSSYTAAGLSTYSNSKSIILSYASIFEILWKQDEHVRFHIFVSLFSICRYHFFFFLLLNQSLSFTIYTSLLKERIT
ncbi:MAG: hypothetical protein ACJ712_00565, partial [Nitrososphaeraceae archaeon]